MIARSLSALSLLALVMVPTTATAGGSSTIRIEPRPYYGAVVTVEQGVRVWRPLPPTRHMIINPTGAPVSVNITDVRETVNHRGLNEGFAAPVQGGYAPQATNGYFAPGLAPGRYHRFNGHGRQRAAGLPVQPMARAAKHRRHFKQPH
jgi:hypothetical protein